MNTTAAAIQAKVTVATIRTWCRVGAVAAAKAAGRWVIDAASLAHRIAIGARRTRKAIAVLTVDAVKAIGGNEWIRGTYHRVYLNDWAQYAGIEVTRYNTGRISSASLGGRGISNDRAGRLLGLVDKLYFDAADGRLHIQHSGAREVEIRYLDGDRDYVDLVSIIFANVRAAVAAI
ncbi:hypothetical protein [Streptomyces sp. NBC_01353]|uniref:hypothetical protein n=1 Tax=Streptomyces sp. NBC_01353 TaxID=2903835 RepID=UPI002E3716ED|nr:hypothetical protein [Streptomyces sp. NBC_01353]